jgi:gamma-glutamylcyclotransferase (GGCT)/AIG2-like uncharacterized protein YtfP
MEQSSYTVFVYGTLKRNQPNHHYLSTAEFITEATCCQKFPLVIASKYNIPFAIEKPGIGYVKLIKKNLRPSSINWLLFRESKENCFQLTMQL